MRFPLALLLGASLVLTAAVACTAFDAANQQPQPPADSDGGPNASDANQGGEPDANNQPDATDNASTCAHDCGGAACQNGACVAIPVLDDIDGLFGITADDADLFYSRRAALGGIGRLGPNGNASEYVPMLDRPNDVVLVGPRLYFAVEGTASIKYMDRAAVAPISVSATATPLRLSADGSGAAWLTASSVVWTSGGLGDLTSQSFDLAAVGEATALTVGNGKTWIVRGVSGGAHALEVFGRPGPRTETVPLPAASVTAIDNGASGVFLAADTGVIVVSNAGGSSVAETVVPPVSLGGEPRGIDELDGVLYVVTDNGDVWRVKPDGTGLTLLARAPACTGERIAVSASWVYWTCMASSTNKGSIRKTPRR